MNHVSMNLFIGEKHNNIQNEVFKETENKVTNK